MNYGLQLSASGMFASMYAMDVAANNLANVETAGFKPDLVSTRMRDAVRPEDGVWNLPSNQLLERLGGGVLLQPNQVSFAQGTLEESGNPLDVAIKGDGFFVVAAGRDGAIQQRLTRDGRFTLDDSGRLVMAASGNPVLDPQNRPIRLDPSAEVMIDPDGTIRQRGAPVARLQVAQVPDPSSLTKEGESLFAASEAAMKARRPATGSVEQGMIEGSAVDAVKAMLAVSKAASAVTANARMLQMHDETVNRAINAFGRVA